MTPEVLANYRQDLTQFTTVIFGPGVRVILAYVSEAVFATPIARLHERLAREQRHRDYRNEVLAYSRDLQDLKAARPPSRPWIRPAYQRAAKKIGPMHVRW